MCVACGDLPPVCVSVPQLASRASDVPLGSDDFSVCVCPCTIHKAVQSAGIRASCRGVESVFNVGVAFEIEESLASVVGFGAFGSSAFGFRGCRVRHIRFAIGLRFAFDQFFV